MPSQVTRQLAAIMFADMVGYTALMNENEYHAKEKRDRFVDVLQKNIDRFSGSLIQNYGDGSLAIFTSALEGVRCAIHVQQQLQTDLKVDLRIGLHTGDIMIDGGNVFGDGVNIASRIESLAVPGSVFISEKIFDEIRNQQEIKTQSLGFFELKNVKQPIHVYAISNSGVIVPSRDEVRGKLKTTLNSIAVLPFASLSSDPENEFFCDGITEELLNVLAKIDGLQVTSRTSSFAFKGKHEDVREIAAKLSVQKILEGSVRKAGNKVRITAQLINASDGYHLWSETYDRSLEDIFEVQDDIARSIANKLRQNLTADDQEKQLVKAPTENLEAYKKYLQALHFYDSASVENRQRSIDLLTEVIRLDPKMVSAHAYLSGAYIFMGTTGQMDANKGIELATFHAVRAMEIDPENSGSLVAMSYLKLHAWEWKEGRRLLQKAIAINPNDAMARLMAGEYHILFLERDEAIANARFMCCLDPLSASTKGEAARQLLVFGLYDEVIELADEALSLDPQSLVSRQMKAFAIGFKGDWKKALELVIETHKISGDFPLVLFALAFIYGMLGEEEKLNEIMAKFEKMQEKNPGADFDFVFAYYFLLTSQFEKFLELYDRGLEKKSLLFIQEYAWEMMRPLWHDERIVASRKKLGLPVYEESRK